MCKGEDISMVGDVSQAYSNSILDRDQQSLYTPTYRYILYNFYHLILDNIRDIIHSNSIDTFLLYIIMVTYFQTAKRLCSISLNVVMFFICINSFINFP
jgi:hypothetical protein